VRAEVVEYEKLGSVIVGLVNEDILEGRVVVKVSIVNLPRGLTVVCQ
jgi:hypothetical protein